MYNDKLVQNIIIIILKLLTFVIINFINYQFLIQSKFKSIQLFKSIHSRFKSKIIKFVDVKKIYIFENNDDDDDNNDDESIFHDIEKKHFITFIKTFFVVNKSINTNIFVVSFTFDASIHESEIFQHHFVTFVITNQSIIIFVAFDVFVHKIDDEIIFIDDINDHLAINFDQFVLHNIFENANESISFFKSVVTLNNNISHEKSDTKNIVQKKFASKSKIVKFRFFKNLIFNISDAFVDFDFHTDFLTNIDFRTFVVNEHVTINHFYDTIF